MKSLVTHLVIALATFAVGVGLTIFMFSRPTSRVVVRAELETVVVDLDSAAGTRRGSCGKREETPEQKAVRLAEEFVARNGYTDLPPDRESLSHESIEWESEVDELLKLRHDTLERRAYGIRYGGRMGGPGWTVVFKPKGRYGNAFDQVGRAVTMDGDFGTLRVEHKDFFLKGVDKKL